MRGNILGKLVTLGCINALVFAFIPPLFSLFAELFKRGRQISGEAVSGLDIPDIAPSIGALLMRRVL